MLDCRTRSHVLATISPNNVTSHSSGEPIPAASLAAAAGRMSRWVVTALPVVLLVAIALLNPGYLDPLFSHTSGRVLFVFATLLVVGGSLVIKRIVDIKV